MRAGPRLALAAALLLPRAAAAQPDPHWEFDKSVMAKSEAALAAHDSRDLRTAQRIYEEIARACDTAFPRDPAFCSKHWGAVMTEAIFNHDDRTADYATIRFRQHTVVTDAVPASPHAALMRVKRADPALDAAATRAMLNAIATGPPARTMGEYADRIYAQLALGVMDARGGNAADSDAGFARALGWANDYDTRDTILPGSHSKTRAVLDTWLDEAERRLDWPRVEAVWRLTMALPAPDPWYLQHVLARYVGKQGREAESIAIDRAALAMAARDTAPIDLRPVRPALYLAQSLAKTPGGLAEARGLLRFAEGRLKERLASYPAFDDAAQAELRSYAVVYFAAVKVCWGLSARPT